jgi:hypothetical protein
MSLDLVAELWNHIKVGMPKVDRDSTAEFIVNMLSEHGLESEDIRELFGSDSDIKAAVIEHFGNEDDEDWDTDSDIDEWEEDDEDY